MTVSSTTNKVSYHLSGSQTAFAYNFKIFEEGDLKVILRNSFGSEAELVLDSDYTVSGAGDENGGSVTTGEAYASGNTLVIIRELALKQETDYSEGGSFSAKSHENVADRLTMICQQVNEKILRSLLLPRSSQYSSLELPEPEPDLVLKWNTAGDGLENSDLVGEQGPKGEKGDPGNGFPENMSSGTVYYSRDGDSIAGMSLEPGSLLFSADGNELVNKALSEVSSAKMKIGEFTRSMSLSSGVQVITGVGFQPDVLIFLSCLHGAPEASWGFDDAESHTGICRDGTSSNYLHLSGVSIKSDNGANTYDGWIQSMDADGFTMKWAKGGSPGSTLNIKYLALKF